MLKHEKINFRKKIDPNYLKGRRSEILVEEESVTETGQ